MIPVLIESALRALLVALTVWAGLRLFRVSNVLAQKAAWGLVLVGAVAMPFLMRWHVLVSPLTLRVPALSWGEPKEPLRVAEAVPAPSAREDLKASRARFSSSSGAAPAKGDHFPVPRITAGEPTATSEIQSVSAPVQALPALARNQSAEKSWPFLRPAALPWILYLAVCGVLLIRMAYGLFLALRLWSTGEKYETEPGPSPERDPGLGLRLRFSFAVSSPVTIGSGVLLPADCLHWDKEKLRIVLAHERAHVRQRDFYLQLMASVYASVFWFSPLGWWLKRKLCDLSEAISDRAGLEEAASRASYARILLEFAALPRPTAIGVAMARSTNLSHRIERLLNESSFRQAFAGSRRILVVFLLVPVALLAGTAMIRVEAAASGQVAPPAAPSTAPNTGPAPAAAPASPGQVPDKAPPPPAAPSAASSPDVVPPAASAVAPVPPEPPSPAEYREIRDSADDRDATSANAQDDTVTNTSTNTNGKHVSRSVGKGYSYSYSSNGDSWALVRSPEGHVNFSGEWNDNTKGSIAEARKLTNGKFLWFTHNGKSYFLDDPGVLSQVEAMYGPIEALGRQQEELGKKQEELGRQQEELGRKQEQASVPTPDISKEMAALNEAVAKLNAKKGSTVSQEELGEIEEKIGDIQGRLGDLHGKMGEEQGGLGELQGKLGEQQGKLGEAQGRLGEEQGRLSEEADRKVKSIIDQSLRDGKAKPVQ